MSKSIRERIIDLLGQNIQQSLVAQAVGVTDSYISQLLVEEGVIEAIAARKAGRLEAAIKKDDSIESLELAALEIVRAKLPFTKSSLEAVRVFQVLNTARKAAQASQGADSAGVQIVQITLPRAANVMIQMNAQNQVIEVAGRSMATLPSRSLPALAKDIIEAEHLAALPPKALTPQEQDRIIANRRLANLVTVVNGEELAL